MNTVLRNLDPLKAAPVPRTVPAPSETAALGPDPRRAVDPPVESSEAASIRSNSPAELHPREWDGAVFERSLRAIDARLMGLVRELERLTADRSLATQLQAECGRLREQHHERETLAPIFRGLIGIADRRRQGIAAARTGPQSPGPAALAELVEAQRADLAEIEALLAAYGVESFRQPTDRFDPHSQKCIKRIPTLNPNRHERLARRLLPGYRRGSIVLRPEFVTVFVLETTH